MIRRCLLAARWALWQLGVDHAACDTHRLEEPQEACITVYEGRREAPKRSARVAVTTGRMTGGADSDARKHA